MSDYHGDGMNIADQLREAVIENKRLRADFARDKAELRQMLADSENEVERLRAEYEATADRVRKECHRDAKDSPLISRYRILRALDGGDS